MKNILIYAIFLSLILTNGIPGCLEIIKDDKNNYEYKLTIKVKNNDFYYVLLPIIEKYHDEDKSLLLSNLKFYQGNGNYSIERVDGRFLNVSSNQDIILSCRGKTSEFKYHPTNLEFKKMGAPSKINDSSPCYIYLNNYNEINITLKWFSQEPESLIDLTCQGIYSLSGWNILNITYNKLMIS